jgi:hypothetical protein
MSMSKDQPATTATFDPLAGFTGRDGAIDHAGKGQVLATSEAPDPEEGFALALGKAVIATWGELARADQERIFECAVVLGHRTERDESLREKLAKFLHDHHARTASAGK